MDYSQAISVIYPTNMRTAHGLRSIADVISVSAVRRVEDIHLDPFFFASSGSGMDAPEELPAGSIKAFVSGNTPVCIGFCQRTIARQL